MTHLFDDDALTGVLRHMNGDHGDDNLLIARAFATDAGVADADITASLMTGFDGDQGVWQVTLGDGSTADVVVPWPSGRCVPSPATQLPLQGAHTPTMAPDDPVVPIAWVTASVSCCTVSSGNDAADCGGRSGSTSPPNEQPARTRADATAPATTAMARRRVDRVRMLTPR